MAGLMFIDLRDHYGVTQLVLSPTTPGFAAAERTRAESVIRIDGEVVARTPETVNPNLPTGEVEIRVQTFEVLSEAAELPVPVFGEPDYPEELRLKYRYLDLRRETLHRSIVLRSQVIASLRRRMIEQGFTEFQTPILTASSPEGARDYLVPSRLYPGQFYALPQAPQQFKQLLMVSGFDRYFQIAPCFRDEAARADRSPGEFYQLDMGDELRHPARRVRRDRARDARGVRGVRRRQARHCGPLPAHPLPRGGAEVRLRQAGPAQPHRDGRMCPSISAAAASASSPASWKTPKAQIWAIPALGRREPRLLRPHERLGQGRGPARPGLHLLARGGGRQAPAPSPRTSAPSARRRFGASWASRPATRSSSPRASRTPSTGSQAWPAPRWGPTSD